MNPHLSRISKLIFISLLAAGCAHDKVLQAHRQKIGMALREDWSHRAPTARFGPSQSTFSEPPQSYQSSKCNSKQMESYRLVSEPDAWILIEAKYCPLEKRYWIEDSSGDFSMGVRWAGPFDFPGHDAQPATAEESNPAFPNQEKS